MLHKRTVYYIKCYANRKNYDDIRLHTLSKINGFISFYLTRETLKHIQFNTIFSNLMINIRTIMKNNFDGKVALKDKILHKILQNKIL